jgi:hypothetical protein
MQRFRFAIAVAVTSLALVVAIGAVGALAVRSALANGPWQGGPWQGGPWQGGAPFQLPPELEGLHDLPPAERFNHFVGAQFTLTDRENKPVAVNVVPGTVTAASATSLTLNANDGTTRTYTLDDKTAIRGKRAQGAAQATQPTLAQDDKVVVMTVNDSTVATAVMVGGQTGFGPPHGRPWFRDRP